MLDKSSGSDQTSSSVFSLQSPATPSGDSFWSKSLKFSSACAVLVTLTTAGSSPPAAQNSQSQSSSAAAHLQLSAVASSSISQQIDANNVSSSEPNSLTCSISECGDELSSSTTTSSSLGTLNRRTKSPVRFTGQLMHKSSSPSTAPAAAGGSLPTAASQSLSSISDAVLLLFKEKNGRYLPCRVSS